MLGYIKYGTAGAFMCCPPSKVEYYENPKEEEDASPMATNTSSLSSPTSPTDRSKLRCDKPKVTSQGAMIFRISQGQGPFTFSFGEGYTEISLDPDPDDSNRFTAQQVAHPQVSKTNGHLSRSELRSGLAAWRRHIVDDQAAISWRTDDQDEEQTPILHDAMGRPVVLDGIVRGMGRQVISCPYVRDSLHRIVISDGCVRGLGWSEEALEKGKGFIQLNSWSPTHQETDPNGDSNVEHLSNSNLPGQGHGPSPDSLRDESQNQHEKLEQDA